MTETQPDNEKNGHPPDIDVERLSLVSDGQSDQPLPEVDPSSYPPDAEPLPEGEQPVELPAQYLIDGEELIMLTRIAQTMIDAGMLMMNPPVIVTATSTQDHQARVKTLINEAGQLAMQWGVNKGLLRVEKPEEQNLVTP
jgi:hypothetical protein